MDTPDPTPAAERNKSNPCDHALGSVRPSYGYGCGARLCRGHPGCVNIRHRPHALPAKVSGKPEAVYNLTLLVVLQSVPPVMRILRLLRCSRQTGYPPAPRTRSESKKLFATMRLLRPCQRSQRLSPFSPVLHYLREGCQPPKLIGRRRARGAALCNTAGYQPVQPRRAYTAEHLALLCCTQAACPASVVCVLDRAGR